MYRIDTANSISSLPTPAALGTEEFFRDGSTGGGDGTLLEADFLNMVQESMIEILDDQSIAHSKTDTSTFLVALRSLIDERIDGIVAAPRGHIAGLIYSPTSSSAFEISPGEARDFADGQIIQLSATKAKDLAIAWDESTGALASGNTITGAPYFGRIFLLGKSGDVSAANIGVDTSATAANLLSDAGIAGWDIYRQVGWALYNVFATNTLATYYQEPNLPDFWRIVDFVPTGFTTLSVTAANKAVPVPAGTRFYGLTYVAIEQTAVATQRVVNLLGNSRSLVDALTDGNQPFIDIEGRNGVDLAYTTTEPLNVRAGAFPNSGALISASSDADFTSGRYEIEHNAYGFWWDRSL